MYKAWITRRVERRSGVARGGAEGAVVPPPRNVEKI